ncbi:MAG: response regulator transcription factor [Vicinamibacterales bacterium]
MTTIPTRSKAVRTAIPMVGTASPSHARVRPLAIISGTTQVVPGATVAIEHAGFLVADTADIALVVDAPVGFALHAIEHRVFTSVHVIVATTNTCPEYVEDIWDYRPDALLAGQSVMRCLAEAVARIDRGETYRLTPGCQTDLTRSERAALRLLAQGWGNDVIASYLRIRPQTVANRLTQIYAALGVDGRDAALLHYWGVYLPTRQSPSSTAQSRATGHATQTARSRDDLY